MREVSGVMNEDAFTYPRNSGGVKFSLISDGCLSGVMKTIYPFILAEPQVAWQLPLSFPFHGSSTRVLHLPFTHRVFSSNKAFRQTVSVRVVFLEAARIASTHLAKDGGHLKVFFDTGITSQLCGSK